MTIEINNRELGTILAALRYYQNDMDDYGKLCVDVDPEGEINEIATNGDTLEQLSAFEIDHLCERINQ